MKKIVSILCLTAIFAQNAFVIEAKELNTTAEQIETVYQLGIMDTNQDGEDDLSKKVTRADFVEMIYKLICDDENTFGATKSYYNDVDIYHYAAAYIQMLSERGIIYGYDDGNFYPNKNITVKEAVTVVLRAIGYDVRINLGESVESIASDIDIGKGLNFSEELTRDSAAKIIYDTLYADTMKVDLQGEGVSTADMVMQEFLGLDYKDGVVDGINGKSLYDDYIPEGIISIDENHYNIACEADETLLGKYVRYYYSEEDEEVRAITARKNSILVINADKIIDSNNTQIIYYDQDAKSKTARIDVKADVLYNGYVVNSISDYIPANGNITLIDRKDDGVYDAVFIEVYASSLVSRVSTYDETVTLYNNNEVINLKNYEKIEIVDENKEELELSAITANSVVSVYKFGTKYIKILKASDKIAGTITSVSTEDGKKMIKIGENLITLCDNCYLGGLSLSVGANVTVYLDAFGMGAAVKTETADDWEFGYLIYAKEDNESLMEDSIRLKVLTLDNKQEIFYILDKTRVDGNKLEINNAMLYLNNVFNNFDDEIANGDNYKKELVTTRLIRFKKNENIITQIDTPIRYGLYEEANKPAMSQNNKLLLRVKGNLYRPESKRSFRAVYSDRIDLQGEIFYSERTPVFVVPTEENTEADENDYSVISGEAFYSSKGEFIYVSSYYTDVNSFTPDAIVVRKDTFESSDTRLLVVKKVTEVWDEYESEVFTQIEGYINGKLMSMKVDKNNSRISLNDIRKGDCIAYDVYAEKLRLNQLVYRKDGGGILNNNAYWSRDNDGSHFNVAFRSVIGRAGHMSDDYMHLKIDSTELTDELVELPDKLVFYDESKSKNALYMSDSSSIAENNIVIVSSRKGILQDVIVIK